MTADFEGKVALVTGAASGMGRATALAFAAAGARVVAADITVDAGEQTIELIRAAGGEGLFVRTDVSSSADVAAAVKAAVTTFGGLDCAANVAAIETETTLLADCEEDTFDRLVAVNLRSVSSALSTRSGRCCSAVAARSSTSPRRTRSVHCPSRRPTRQRNTVSSD